MRGEAGCRLRGGGRGARRGARGRGGRRGGEASARGRGGEGATGRRGDGATGNGARGQRGEGGEGAGQRAAGCERAVARTGCRGQGKGGASGAPEVGARLGNVREVRTCEGLAFLGEEVHCELVRRRCHARAYHLQLGGDLILRAKGEV